MVLNNGVFGMKKELLHYNKKSLSRTDYIKVMIVVQSVTCRMA
jgi:hypothetical protein